MDDQLWQGMKNRKLKVVLRDQKLVGGLQEIGHFGCVNCENIVPGRNVTLDR